MTSLEITKEQLIKAMCAKTPPCGAHKDAAEKIWTKLEKTND